MNCKTDLAFSFIYKTKFENGLTEHEYDHVYLGVTDNLPVPEKSEVKNYRYMNIENLETDIRIHPENYTEWMKICLPQVRNHFDKIFKNIPHKYASI